MKFPSGLVLHLCEDKFQATICTFKIHVEVISVRAENATLSWKNAKYLRTLGRVSHRCHDELDAPQQLHPPAESHLQILWQTDRQKDFRGQNATDNLCINPYPQPHSPPPSIITSYICPRCISTLTHSKFLTYYTICFSSGGAWQGRLIFFFFFQLIDAWKGSIVNEYFCLVFVYRHQTAHSYLSVNPRFHLFQHGLFLISDSCDELSKMNYGTL